MRTNYDFKNTDLSSPVAFRSNFNNFQSINPTQAWSLFFTASKEDKLFGSNSKAGLFFTICLGVTVLALAFWVTNIA